MIGSAQTFGTSNNVTFQNNLVTNTTFGDIDFLIDGQSVAIRQCAQASYFPLVFPTNSAIIGNSISGGKEGLTTDSRFSLLIKSTVAI